LVFEERENDFNQLIEIPDTYILNFFKNDIRLEMSFVYSRFDLVNILDFVGLNPAIKECEFQCNEVIFDENKYHSNRHFHGEQPIPPSTAVLVYDKD